MVLQAHYECFRTRYGNKVELVMTDTDSLIYRIETEDMLQDFVEASLEAYPDITFDIVKSLGGEHLTKIAGELNTDPDELLNKFKGIKGKLGAFKLETLNTHIREYVGMFTQEGCQTGCVTGIDQ